MHYVQAKSILSAQNGMNLYRGCQHGCIYCDSRSLCYQMNHPFEDIEVKENALLLLEQALKAKRKKCIIGTGAMSDPYIPLEEKLRLTRGALELISRYGFGVAIQTKSCRILRDLDLLKEIQTKLGTATILVSHDLGVVARCADRVAIMYAGKIVEIGTAEEVYHNPRHPYTWGLMQSLPALNKGAKELKTIPGMPPTLIDPPAGDAFACRNEYALEIDYHEQPPMFQITDTHYAATWLLDPRAPKVESPMGGKANV